MTKKVTKEVFTAQKLIEAIYPVPKFIEAQAKST
jgi:hypothetical protein